MRLTPDGEHVEAERRERFALLYQAHYLQILGYVLRRRQSSEDAADIVAESFLTAWRRLDDVPEEPATLLWMYGVARRILANHHRGTRRRLHLEERLRQEIATLGEAIGPAESSEIEDVRKALAQLRERDREILGLVAWEGLSSNELGIVLGCSANAAKIRLHRARKRLAARLSHSGVAEKPGHATGHEGAERVRAHHASKEDP